MPNQGDRMDRTQEFLKELVEAHGAPGFEGNVAKVMETHMKGVGSFSDFDVRENLDIQPGDPIVPDSPFHVMANPNLLLAKAWDNRVGCGLAAETVRQLGAAAHPNTVYAVATVQEEVGLRGAQTSVHKINPDVAFALDVGIAHDTPGTEGDEKLGGGPLIVVYDSSAIPNRRLLDLVVDTAKRLKIPLQFESVERGGTDAGRIHLNAEGVPSISMGCAARYIHSHVSIIDRRDFDRTVKLLVALVKRLDRKTVETLA